MRNKPGNPPAVRVSQSVADEQSKRRLVREAQAAAALDHPNICSIYEVNEIEGRAFIVMPFIDGETLAARIQRKPLTVTDALEIAIPVAAGLAEAHARGIVHRDIKPQNIMLTARGQVKILDFGLAKVFRDSNPGGNEVQTQSVLTQAGAIVGTAPYMSPEQVKGEPLDPRSDVFSFGAVLYEMVSGHYPFSARTAAETIAAVLTAEPPMVAAHGVAAPAGLERVLRQCLRKDREQRYQTMREVVLELESVGRESVRDSGASIPCPDTVASAPNRPARNRAAPFGAMLTSHVAFATVVNRARV